MIYFQVSLLLEYCSNGDLKSYLIQNREEIENALMDFKDHGFEPSFSRGDSASNNILDIKMILRWVYQVCKS